MARGLVDVGGNVDFVFDISANFDAIIVCTDCSGLVDFFRPQCFSLDEEPLLELLPREFEVMRLLDGNIIYVNACTDLIGDELVLSRSLRP